MECYAHPGVAAVGMCTVCGRAICEQDAVDVQGRLVCREDLAKGRPQAGKGEDPNTAFLLELLPGLIGFLGIGYMYAGRTGDGVARLIVWLIFVWGAWIIAWLLSFAIIGLCLMPVILVAQVAVPIWSAFTLKESLMATASVAATS